MWPSVLLSTPANVNSHPGQCKWAGRRDWAASGRRRGCGRDESQSHAAYFNISGLISHSKQNGRQTCFRHQLHAPHLSHKQNLNQCPGPEPGSKSLLCTGAGSICTITRPKKLVNRFSGAIKLSLFCSSETRACWIKYSHTSCILKDRILNLLNPHCSTEKTHISLFVFHYLQHRSANCGVIHSANLL